jgi:hypothetical protein
MPTDVNSVIGTSGDYTTPQAWEDAAPSNLVTDDKRWIGKLKKQVFTGGLTISGITTDSTRYVILQCDTSASFYDAGDIRTAALTYDDTRGATISYGADRALTCNVQYTVVDGVQFLRTTYETAININGTGIVVKRCIIKGGTNGGGATAMVNGGAVLTNSIVWHRRASDVAIQCYQGEVRNCTVLNTASAGTSSAFSGTYSQPGIVKNTAVFGFTNFVAAGSTATGSDYNATNLSSASTGTHNQTSLTAANEIESTSGTDFRAKSGGTAQNAGTPDTTYASDDISKTTRDATTPDIGAWENVSAASPTIFFPAFSPGF